MHTFKRVPNIDMYKVSKQNMEYLKKKFFFSPSSSIFEKKKRDESIFHD